MKRALITVVVLAASIHFAPRCQAEQQAPQKTEASETQAPPVVPAHTGEQSGPGHYEGRTDKTPRWYESPEWVLVIVGSVTCIVIGWQAIATQLAARATKRMIEPAIQSAEAARLSVEMLIKKERVRIRIEMASFIPTYPEAGEEKALELAGWVVKFYGATNAFIDEYSADAVILDSPEPTSKELLGGFAVADLPAVVAPGTPPFEHSEPFLASKFEIDSLYHKKAFLHVRVVIKYHDFSELVRESSAYHMWVPYGFSKSGKLMAEGKGIWRQIGPPEANRET
jgi:hypothetical protein